MRPATVPPSRRPLRGAGASLAVLAALSLAPAAHAGPLEPLALAPDSPRWQLEGQVAPAEVLGRRCLHFEGGAAASVRDLTLRDGVVDMDVTTRAVRGFFGVQFRVTEDGQTAEYVYLRPHKSGYPDALQYTPVLHSGANWQLYNGPGFTAGVTIPTDRWFHVRLAFAGAQAKLYVDDMTRPALDMTDLKSDVREGGLALYSLLGDTCVADVTVHATTPEMPWQRHLPAMPPQTLVRWQLSPSFDALQRDPEKPLAAAEIAGMSWQDVEAEPPGLVPINRYRDSPHPRVTFQRDFSTRLEPQPGAAVVYARTTIDAPRDEVRKLALGYSDEVSVFLNGRILWRGRSAQAFRDPLFLGIVDPEDDAIWLPLHEGRNELVLGLTELGGGWGFVARLGDPEPAPGG